MRIALLSAEYPPDPGGVGDYTRRLGLALLARGLDVQVLTGQHTVAITMPPRALELDAAGWGWRSWRGITVALEQLRPDVLHIQYQTGAYAMHPAINLLPWRLRREHRRPKVVVTAHDLLEPYLLPKAGPLRRWVTRRLLADAEAAVVTNEQDAAQARVRLDVQTRLIPIGSNILVAPPPDYERGRWRAGLGVGTDEMLVAYFGMISRSKGIETLLDALEQLPLPVRLLLIGGPSPAPHDQAYAASIQAQIGARGLGTRVQITGHCGEDMVSAHLLAADLVALPFADGATFRRGSLLAALAHGVPVVTTAHPPGNAALEGAALLVPPGDATALAGAISRLRNDSALGARLSGAGQALARSFSWERIAEQHEELYRALNYSSMSNN
ncbi:MAG TPA: glycosyltransferase [Roseiflexaceae bacterium]|nr:glycosyltransferase [Roseiflexaceae bacterium]